MNRRLTVLVAGTFLLLSLRSLAEVAPVAVRLPEASAWIGQRVSVYYELRALGSFSGTATFQLPQLPGTLMVKIGNPVVSSETIDDTSWFVQTHEFALFTQKSGLLKLPSFPVRFERQEGFTGPPIVVDTQTPATTVEIQRPPGSESGGFLITTESLDLTETWNPAPSASRVGTMFKRTITQRALNMTGMALAPAPLTAPDGIRVYPGTATTHDQLDRGNFLGERCETLTYLMQQPGTHTLPAITYTWWNPKIRALQSKILPAVTFDITASPQPVGVASRHAWPYLLAAAVFAFCIWQRHRLTDRYRQIWKVLQSPDRVAARKLLRACRQNDAALASAAWAAWRNTQPAAFQPDSTLQIAILSMQEQQFGVSPAVSWPRDELSRAFSQHLATRRSRATRENSALPPLNPHS